jgi:ubiquinone/menaquinone biosynthesis C-methylase UbiE
MAVQDSTQRFSSRVDNYARYRPGYPAGIMDLLRNECGLRPDWVIADIASGTGIFTRMLLENGNTVFGVEPNAKMREAGERHLVDFPCFTSIAGSAEATTLAAQSVHLLTAAQAAHWFDIAKARREFVRILKPAGWCVLVWNERRLDSIPFLREYENLLQHFGSDYRQVRHELTTARIHEFFEPSPFREQIFPSRQEFSYAALQGRLLSSSYAPQAGDVKYRPMLRELERIFAAHQIDGKVAFEYNTRVFFGQLSFEQLD